VGCVVILSNGWRKANIVAAVPPGFERALPDHSSKRSRFTRLAETNGILAANHSHLNECAIAAQTDITNQGGLANQCQYLRKYSARQAIVAAETPASSIIRVRLQVAFDGVALRAQGKIHFLAMPKSRS